ncbi:MAG: CBS domain-containing protein [Cytophagales bacterium]|nr:CBS domain-containing protein [Cytophagales bacterium]
MIAKELINFVIPALTPDHSIHRAFEWMQAFRITQLPVVESKLFKGFLSEETFFDQIDKDLRTKDFSYKAVNCFIHADQHFYDLLKTASDHESNLVAVLDDNNEYVGVITVEDTITALAQTAAIQIPGAILVLLMDQVQYSLAEVSRLVESENMKVVSSFINHDQLDPSLLKLTIKVDKTAISHLVRTLERFDYKVLATFQETNVISNERERLDQLMNYLNI